MKGPSFWCSAKSSDKYWLQTQTQNKNPRNETSKTQKLNQKPTSIKCREHPDTPPKAHSPLLWWQQPIKPYLSTSGVLLICGETALAGEKLWLYRPDIAFSLSFPFWERRKQRKRKKKRHRKHPHQTRPQKGIQIQKQTLELQGFRYFFIYICPILNTFFWIFNHKTELKKIDKKLRKGSGSFGYQGQNFHSGRGTTERDLQRGIVCELWDFSIPALDTCTACAESGVNFLGTPSMARGQCQRKWCCQRRVSWIWNW